MPNVLETDFLNRPASTPVNTGGRRSESGGQGAEFVARLQHAEAEQPNQDVAIGAISEPDLLPPNRRRATHAEVLERASNLGVPQLSGSATDGGDFAATETNTAKPDAVIPDAAALRDRVQTATEPEKAAGAIRPDITGTAAVNTASALAARLKPTAEPGPATAPVSSAAADPSALTGPGIAAQIRETKVAALPLTPEGLLAGALEQDAAGVPASGVGELAFATGKTGNLLVSDTSSVILQPVSPLLVSANGVVANAPGLSAAGQGIITAAPAEIVDIISQSLSSNQERKDRIIVQLDPPELGRVSIDFKFDAQGLQHVTITGETPEALRRLRMMHSELIQTLQENGLDGQSMTFRHQQQQPGAGAGFGRAESAPPETGTITVQSAQPPPNSAPAALLAGGLDIKL